MHNPILSHTSNREHNHISILSKRCGNPPVVFFSKTLVRYWTDFSTASKMLNLNNVATVESKASEFALPRHSNVSKKPHTRNRQVPQCGVVKHPPIQCLEEMRHRVRLVKISHILHKSQVNKGNH